MDMNQAVGWWANISWLEISWLAVGFMAQAMFSMRFLMQWIASERARRSVMPEVFWYYSFAGGLMLFVYAIYRVDPVFILGQGTGLLIYSRNIYFIWRAKKTVPAAAHEAMRAPAAKVPAE
jgi:lipid-A-disaccharide synthase-like uncharacterized protein